MTQAGEALPAAPSGVQAGAESGGGAFSWRMPLIILGAVAAGVLAMVGSSRKDKRFQIASAVLGVALLSVSSLDTIRALSNQPGPAPPLDEVPVTAASDTAPPPVGPPVPVTTPVAPPPPQPTATSSGTRRPHGRDPFAALPPPPPPPPPVDPASLPPPPATAGLVLTAVFTSGRTAAYAILNDTAVTVGERVSGGEGWELKAVRENGVVLMKDGKDYYLPIR